MTDEHVPTYTTRQARRRRNSRPASKTLARVGLVVSIPGASILAATGGQAAGIVAAGKHHHDAHTTAPLHTGSPLVAMRRIIEQETAAATTTTTRPPAPAPAPTPAPTSTTSPPAPVAVEAAAPAPRDVRPPPSPPAVTAPPRPAPHPAPRPAPPRPAPAPVAPVHTAGIVPPGNPPESIPPDPQFEGVCLSAGPMSPGCLAATLQATDTARSHEGLGPMRLPGDYSALTAPEQLFVLADTERVDRGLPPATGLVDQLDQDAETAAGYDTDPTPSLVPPGVSILAWASNWGENAGALGSNYSWMYDDGPGSGNEACGSGGGGCWGHRDNILGFSAAQLATSHGTLVMGAAEAQPPAAAPWMSDTELFAVISGHPASFVYTWAQAVASGAG